LIRNLAIGVVMGLVAGMASEILIVRHGELLAYDWRMGKRGIRDRNPSPITLVMIDDEVKYEEEGFEIPRLAYLARVVDLIKQKGAKVIGLDIILAGTRLEEPGAQELQTSVRFAGNVVLSGRAFAVVNLGQENLKPPAFLIEAAAGNGLQHLVQGEFGLVRETYVRKSLTGDQTSNSFAVFLAAMFEGLSTPESFTRLEKGFWTTPFTLEISPPNEYQIAINYSGKRTEVGTYDGTFPCLRADLGALAQADSRHFADRIVIIGSDRRMVNDSYPTPVSFTGAHEQVGMTTSEILANVVEMVLQGDFVRFPTRPIGIVCWLVLVGMLAGAFCLSRKLLPVLFWILLFTLAIHYIWRYLLEEHNLVMPFLPTLLVPWMTALGCLAGRTLLDDREMKALYEVFGRSVSPAIAQELVANVTGGPKRGERGGSHLLSEECECSILFLDVANFTTLSENLSPVWLFKFINELLDRLSKCVFENEGSLIRYTGDGLIALFGRPIVREDHAILASEAALKMQEELEALNRMRQKQGEPTVTIRLGINTGTMMVGLLGGNQRYDYSVLGNEVNVAARFESLNKDFGTGILVGESTLKQLKNRFICRPLGSISLKGKTEQVSVYELVCRTGRPLPDSLKEFLKLYEVGYTAIRSNRFTEAISAFNNALVYKPDDLATQKLLARAEERTRTGTSYSSQS
jgi:class 3 adenylate cyclase